MAELVERYRFRRTSAVLTDLIAIAPGDRDEPTAAELAPAPPAPRPPAAPRR
jgi:hypothetical protein